MFNPYGLTLALAIFAAYLLTAYRAQRHGLSADLVWESLPWVIGFGVLGARFYHILNFSSFYLEHPLLIPQVWRGGLGIWGGLLGGILGLAIFLRRRERRAEREKPGVIINYELLINNLLDAAAPGVALAQAIGRLGNVWNGENLPFAWWEMGADLVIFVSLLVFEKCNENAKCKNQNGDAKVQKPPRLFAIYLLSYSAARFLFESFRSDSPWIVGPLTMAQLVSLTGFLIGSWLLTTP